MRPTHGSAPVGDGVPDDPLSDAQPANGSAPVGDGVLDVPPPGTHTGVIVRFRLILDPGRIFTVPGGASPSPTASTKVSATVFDPRP